MHQRDAYDKAQAQINQVKVEKESFSISLEEEVRDAQGRRHDGGRQRGAGAVRWPVMAAG